MSGSCDSCNSADCSVRTKQPGESQEQYEERIALERRLCKIDKKIAVISGKGGVGKSTVAVNLAVSLSLMGKKTGLLDIDIHGPSIPTMLNFKDTVISSGSDGMEPLVMGNLKVMSIGFLLRDVDDPVIFRGPRKLGLIKQFLKDVNWGELDYLIIDSPPGTGDEPLALYDLIKDITGAVVVTTPQEVSGTDVRKSINFCNEVSIPLLGLVENMDGFICPNCDTVHKIFGSGSGNSISKKYGIELLGTIPIEPKIVEACDAGKPFVYNYNKTETAKKISEIIEKIEMKAS